MKITNLVFVIIIKFLVMVLLVLSYFMMNVESLFGVLDDWRVLSYLDGGSYDCL